MEKKLFLLLSIVTISINNGFCQENNTKSDSKSETFVQIKTPNSNLEAQITKVDFNSSAIFIEFVITNKGEDIESYIIRPTGSDYDKMTYAYDNTGNRCVVKTYLNDGQISITDLPQNVPVKIIAGITGFSPSATSFSQIKIFGCRQFRVIQQDPMAGDFVFTNVPIR